MADEAEAEAPATGGKLAGFLARLVAAKARKEEEARAAERAARAAAGEEPEEGEEEEAGASAGYDDLKDKLDALKQMMYSLDVEGAAEEPRKEPLLESFDVKGVAELIRSGRAKNIVVMCGAGISVSAGIPDFRTPGTGLYDNLAKYSLPHPQAVFELDYFRDRPEPFYRLAKELYPGRYRPTPTHHFLKLLHDKGLLRRCFTQNIDSLEHLAGLPDSKYVAAHGNFDHAHCIGEGRHPVDPDDVRAAVERAEPLRCERCGALVKPDIVFFGENLPARFFQLVDDDLPQCDLLLVMGTSLAVQPFASLVNQVEDDCPRLLINREKVGEVNKDAPVFVRWRMGGFDFSEETNYRDALFLGDCDAGVTALCRELGWEDDLASRVRDFRLDGEGA